MKPNQAQREFFDQVPGFVHTLRNIAEHGFFTAFLVNVIGNDGIISYINITGEGSTPIDVKYMVPGIDPQIINAEEVLARITAMVQAKSLKPTSFSCDVGTVAWNQWNQTNTKILRLKGTKTKFHLSVGFETTSQAKRLKL